MNITDEARSAVFSHVVVSWQCSLCKKDVDRYAALKERHKSQVSNCSTEERELFGGMAVMRKGGEYTSLCVCVAECAGAVNI